MSRSQRKTPIYGRTQKVTEREDKRIWHSRLRAKLRTRLAGLKDDEHDGVVLPEEREASNPWLMDKDGKVWISKNQQEAFSEEVANDAATAPERLARLKRELKKWVTK